MPSPALTESRDARRHFPAGLLQPEGCARFGMDTLLLAAFAARSLHALSFWRPLQPAACMRFPRQNAYPFWSWAAASARRC